MTILLAAISGNALVKGIIYLLIVGIVCGLLLWLVSKAPIPEPFRNVIVWVIYLVAVLFLINWLLGFTGHSFITL